MANELSAAQSKAKHVAAMGSELGSVYDALWQQLAWLHRNWSEYVVLFGTKESRVSLMNEAAPSFTRIVQDALWEKVLLDIARITDPPKSAGKSNLTVQALPALVGHPTIRATIETRIAEALLASDFCRDWRNRHIAHRDLRLAIEPSAEPLKPASRLKVKQALAALDAVLNAVSSHYLDSTTYFAFEAVHGGAMSLLHIVDAGLEADRGKRARLQSGVPDPQDFEPREV